MPAVLKGSGHSGDRDGDDDDGGDDDDKDNEGKGNKEEPAPRSEHSGDDDGDDDSGGTAAHVGGSGAVAFHAHAHVMTVAEKLARIARSGST